MQTFQTSTVETYYKKLSLLFEGQSLSDPVGKLDIDKILDKLGLIKHSNQFSQSKNAFLQFCKFQSISLSVDTLERIRTLEADTRKKRRQLKAVNYSDIDKKIKRLRDKRLKLSYQTMLATGLRVSELADISPANCKIANDSITFSFTARGGAKAVTTVHSAEYPKLYIDLQALIESTIQSQHKRLFYSTNFLQRKAKALGFGCHDLRRVFAKLEYKKSQSKIAVAKKMRHKSLKATKIYLHSKVKI